MLQLLFCLALFSAVANTAEGFTSSSTAPTDEKTYLAGKAQYENMLRNSEMPDFGECWRLALNRATDGCKHLTNTLTHQLAYGFTRCFYSELGDVIPECTVSPEQCKDNLNSSVVQGTYALFFMHTRDMCYFLENAAWQKKTEETVFQLSESSQQVVERLENAEG